MKPETPLQYLGTKNLFDKVGLMPLRDNIPQHDAPTSFPVERCVEQWKRYTRTEKVKKIDTVYGAMRIPDTQPKAVVFLDIDGIFRKASQTVRDFFEEPTAGKIETEDLANVHEFASGLSRPIQNRKEILPATASHVEEVLLPEDVTDEQRKKIAKAPREAILDILLSLNKAEPVDQITSIMEQIKAWQEQGIYVSAITSSRERTTEGTLKFLQEHVPDCLDAVIFCRPEKGTQRINKGRAAMALIDEIPNRQDPITAVLIDDAAPNARAFTQELSKLQGSRVATIVPDMNSHLDMHPEIILSGDPLRAFQDADAFLQESLEESNHFDSARCPEWISLKDPDMAVSPEAKSPGEEPEQMHHPEEEKTILSLFSLHHIYNGTEAAWEKLTKLQHPDKKLTKKTFLELSALFRRMMPNQEDVDAMSYIMLIHDIGKNPDIMRSVGLNPEKDSHDEGLRKLFLPEYEEQQRTFLPTYAHPTIFNEKQKKMIANILQLPFNFPGFIMSQCSQEEIKQIETIDRRTRAIHAIHGLLDIAGVRVDRNNQSSSLILDEPTTQRILDATKAVIDPPEVFGLPSDTEMSAELRNRLYLQTRFHRLNPNVTLNTDNFLTYGEAMTQTQLANKFRIDTPEAFFELQEAYEKLPIPIRSLYTLHLAGDGINVGSIHSHEYGTALIQALSTRNSLAEALTHYIQIVSFIKFQDFMRTTHQKKPPIKTIELKHLVEAAKKGGKLDIIRYKFDGNTVIYYPSDTTEPNTHAQMLVSLKEYNQLIDPTHEA